MGCNAPLDKILLPLLLPRLFSEVVHHTSTSQTVNNPTSELQMSQQNLLSNNTKLLALAQAALEEFVAGGALGTV